MTVHSVNCFFCVLFRTFIFLFNYRTGSSHETDFFFFLKSNYMTDMLCSFLGVWIQLLWQINMWFQCNLPTYSIFWSVHVCFAGSNQCSMSVDSKGNICYIYLHVFQMIPMEVLRLSSWSGICSTGWFYLEWFNRVWAGNVNF